MTDENLSSSARALLDAARPALGPDPAALRRMRAGIAANVATGAGAMAAAKSTVGAKLAIASIVAMIGVGVALVVLRSDGRVAMPAVAPPMHEHVEAPGSASHVERAPAPPASVDSDEAELPAVDVRRPATPAKPPVASATTKAAGASLAREVALIDRAMTSLRAKDYAAALAALRDHATETAGKGQLAEDAAAIEVEVYCSQKAADGRARLAAFDRTYPSSAQHARLEDACR